MLGQLRHGVQRQLQARVGRHAVQNHRHRAAVRHLQDETRRDEPAEPLSANSLLTEWISMKLGTDASNI